MKKFLQRGTAAFTIIEMIGVLAVMGILAAVVAPNVVRSIDRASVTAEIQTVRSLDGQLKLYLRNKGSVPATTPAPLPSPPNIPGWATALGTYGDISPLDVYVNKRQMNRSYIIDPLVNPTRAMFISSMRNGLAIPTAAVIFTTPQFDAIWNTADGVVPSTLVPGAWAGWAAWAAVGNSGDYLVIDRVNLTSEYHQINLHNASNVLPAPPAAPLNKPASYKVMAPGNPAPVAMAALLPGVDTAVPGPPLSFITGATIYLYSNATYTAPADYVYVVSTDGKSFEFDGLHWTIK